MVIEKGNTYQRSYLIVAASLLSLLVLIVVAGTSGGQHLQSSANEFAKDAVTVADYPADSAMSTLTKDIFLGAVAENEERCGTECNKDCIGCCCFCVLPLNFCCSVYPC